MERACAASRLPAQQWSWPCEADCKQVQFLPAIVFFPLSCGSADGLAAVNFLTCQLCGTRGAMPGRKEYRQFGAERELAQEVQRRAGEETHVTQPDTRFSGHRR